MSILTILIVLIGVAGTLVAASMLLYVLYTFLNSGQTEEAKEEFLIGRIQGARQNYHDALDSLKRNPRDKRLRRSAFQQGMRYGELMNKYLESTLYDEEQILEDIQAVMEGRDPFAGDGATGSF